MILLYAHTDISASSGKYYWEVEYVAIGTTRYINGWCCRYNRCEWRMA